jgi:hypothetical protein
VAERGEVNSIRHSRAHGRQRPIGRDIVIAFNSSELASDLMAEVRCQEFGDLTAGNK